MGIKYGGKMITNIGELLFKIRGGIELNREEKKLFDELVEKSRKQTPFKDLFKVEK